MHPRISCAVQFALLLAVGGCRNLPPDAPLLFGPARARPGDTVHLSARSVDPDGDSIQYRADWGDGSESGWSDTRESGDPVAFLHVYGDTGRFGILGHARDRAGESPLSDTLPVLVFDYGPYAPARPRASGGTDSIAVGDTTGFLSSARHPLDESVALQFDWGDTLGGWTGYVGPGDWVQSRHAWMAAGVYAVSARARDSGGHLSGWSEPCTVVVAARSANFGIAPRGLVIVGGGANLSPDTRW